MKELALLHVNPKTCFGKSAALGQPVERPIKNVEKPIENYVGKPTQVVDVGMQKLKHWHVPSKENDMHQNARWFQSELSCWHKTQKQTTFGILSKYPRSSKTSLT